MIREVVSILRPGLNDSDTLDFSTYGFLYGTFPSAPGVFVFATQYNVDIDLVNIRDKSSSHRACCVLMKLGNESQYEYRDHKPRNYTNARRENLYKYTINT